MESVLRALGLQGAPEPGRCQCGCGGRTRIADQRDARTYGCPVGEPVPYLPFHTKRKRPSLEERECGYATPCWLWTGPATSRYPLLRAERAYVSVVRLVYERLVGPLRDGEPVRRRCRQLMCVRPDHLAAVSTTGAYVERSESDGLCLCGCGRATELATGTDTSRGLVAGMPRRYVRGHERRRGQIVVVERGFLSACWEVTGGRCSGGYASRDGERAHRAVVEAALGAPLGDLVVHHRCRNRACCRLDHLVVISAEMNARGGVGRPPAEEALTRIRTSYRLSRRPEPGLPEYVIAELDFETPCWIWLRALSRNGYPHLEPSRAERRKPAREVPSRYAHRLSYEAHFGPVPPGLELDHLCGHRCCINPAHLEAVTRAENVRRRVNRHALRDRLHAKREGADDVAIGASAAV